jgi:hypothetical protein
MEPQLIIEYLGQVDWAINPLLFVPAAAQLFSGIRQNRMAKDLEPSNYIPPALLEAENSQRRAANATSLPGQEGINEQIRISSAASNEAVRRGSKDSATVLEKIQEQEAMNQATQRNMSIQLENYRDQKEEDLNRTLVQKAGVQEQNQRQYEEAKSALKGAAGQNIYNALTGAAQAAILGKYFENEGGAKHDGTAYAGPTLTTQPVTTGYKNPYLNNTPFVGPQPAQAYPWMGLFNR